MLLAAAIGLTFPSAGVAAQPIIGVTASLRPVFPAEAAVGQTEVPATIEMGSTSVLPVFVTSLTLRAPGLRLAPTAVGSGTGCPGATFAVSPPDSEGTHTLVAQQLIILPPLAIIFQPTCVVGLTFDVLSGNPDGSDLRQTATLQAFTLPFFPSTVTGASAVALRRLPTTVSVAVPPSPPAGAPVGATATVSAVGRRPAGSSAPGGTVTFELFGPGDPACRRPPVRTTAGGALSEGATTSVPVVVTTPGSYRWIARYSGDAEHAPAASACSAAVQVAATALTAAPPATPPTTAGTEPAPETPVAAPSPPAARAPGPAPSRRSTRPAIRPYDPAAHAEEVVGLQVSAIALLALAGASGSAAGSRGAQSGSGGGGREAGELVVTEVEAADEGLVGIGAAAIARERGDRSSTWRWPGTAAVDRASANLPQRIAHRSPLLARVLNDAGYLRAMLGAASVVLPLAGAVLGVLALVDVGGEALPPAFGLAVALAVLGVFDALAGMVAVAVFVGGVVVLGGVSSADAARTLLGLATLWFAAPLIAGTARPLRRPPTLSFEEHFDRTADVVIASLVGAWAVLKIVQGLPGLSGLDLPIADKAEEVALIVLAALIIRMLIETAAAHWYPRRLAEVHPNDLPEPSAAQRVAASLFLLGVLLFVAVPYLGWCWQLYVGGALLILPKLLQFASDKFPNLPRLRPMTPQGIVQAVLLLLVGVILGAFLLERLYSGKELIRNSFVLLSLPGLAIALLELLGRKGDPREWRWQQQLFGIPVIILGMLLVLGVVG